MKRIIEATLSVLVLLLPLSADNLIVPHVVDGAGWQSTIVLTNTTGNAANATLIFHKETTNGNTQAWTPPFVEVISTSGLSVVGGSSLFLHTQGTAADLSQGWAELNADAGITGYVVFSIHSGASQNDGTAPIGSASGRLLVPYDDTPGFLTGVAIVNPTSTAQNISVGFRNSAGTLMGDHALSVPAGGHKSFILSTEFPGIKNHAGLAEFYSASGTFSMIALRVNPTNAFTAAPVYFQSGAPLISTSSDPGNPYDPGPTDPGNPYPPPYYLPSRVDH